MTVKNNNKNYDRLGFYYLQLINANYNYCIKIYKYKYL